MIKIIIKNDDDNSQSNGDVMGRRCCCNCEINVVASSTEVPATSKSTECPKVQ